MELTEFSFVKEFVAFAEAGWQKGWHERNGGNLSYRVPAADIDACRDLLDFSRPYAPIGTAVPALGGQFFLVTGSGKYMSNVQKDPADTCALIELDEAGENYRIVWGLINGGRPTSELPTHLMNHEVKMLATDGAHRVIYHCHPVNLIALTFILPLEDEYFSRELWEMMTECPIIFPAGIGVIPWMVPGGREIAVVTAEKMKVYDAAVWAHHGLFCSGADFDATFGLAHTIEKSAEIYVKVHSVVEKKRQTITKDDFIRLAKDFGVTLTEEFLK